MASSAENSSTSISAILPVGKRLDVFDVQDVHEWESLEATVCSLLGLHRDHLAKSIVKKALPAFKRVFDCTSTSTSSISPFGGDKASQKIMPKTIAAALQSIPEAGRSKLHLYDPLNLQLQCAFIILAARYLPAHLQSNLFGGRQDLLAKYPELAGSAELDDLTRYRNWLTVVLCVASNNKKHAIWLTLLISEGRTCTFGGGLGTGANQRVSIFRTESGVTLVPSNSKHSRLPKVKQAAISAPGAATAATTSGGGGGSEVKARRGRPPKRRPSVLDDDEDDCDEDDLDEVEDEEVFAPRRFVISSRSMVTSSSSSSFPSSTSSTSTSTATATATATAPAEPVLSLSLQRPVSPVSPASLVFQPFMDISFSPHCLEFTDTMMDMEDLSILFSSQPSSPVVKVEVEEEVGGGGGGGEVFSKRRRPEVSTSFPTSSSSLSSPSSISFLSDPWEQFASSASSSSSSSSSSTPPIPMMRGSSADFGMGFSEFLGQTASCPSWLSSTNYSLLAPPQYSPDVVLASSPLPASPTLEDWAAFEDLVSQAFSQ